MICPYCGETLKDTVRFCTNCGKKQPEPEEQAHEAVAAEEQPCPEQEEPATGAQQEEAADQPAGSQSWTEQPRPEGPAGGQGKTEQATGTTEPEPPVMQAAPSQGGTLNGTDILLFGVSMIEMFWVARLFGIAAMVFAIRAFFKRRDGDEEAAHASRRICAILLLVGLAVKVLSWLLGIIFKVGAVTTILGWLGKLL